MVLTEYELYLIIGLLIGSCGVVIYSIWYMLTYSNYMNIRDGLTEAHKEEEDDTKL